MVLVELVGDEKRIEFMREMAEELMVKNPTKKYRDIILYGTSFEFFIRPLKFFADEKDAPDGYYLTTQYTLSDSITVMHTENAKEKKVESGLSFFVTDKLNHGKCDNWKDIEEYYPEMRDSGREFCVLMRYFERGEELTDESWENINDGKYIGNADTMQDINTVFTYHIHEFVDETVKERIDKIGFMKFHEIMKGERNE